MLIFYIVRSTIFKKCSVFFEQNMPYSGDPSILWHIFQDVNYKINILAITTIDQKREF